VRLFEGSRGAIDEEWMDDTLIDLTNLSGLSETEAKRIRMLDAQPLERVKQAFLSIDRAKARKARKRYSEPVNASEYIIDTADNEIELSASPIPFGDIDMVDHGLQQFADPEPEPELIDVGDVDLFGEMSDVDLSEPGDQSQLDMLWVDAGDVTLYPEETPLPPLDIDDVYGEASAGMEFPSILEEAQVELGEPPTGIFEGIDVIDLDDETDPEAPLDIDMNSEIEW